MKKKDERLLPVNEFPDPGELMPDPRLAREKLKAESKEPKPEIKVDQVTEEEIITQEIQEKPASTKADKYRR